MKIRGTQKIEIEISDTEARGIAILEIKKVVGWDSNSNVYVDGNGFLVKEKVKYGSHSWTDKESTIASPLDIAAQTLITKLQEAF